MDIRVSDVLLPFNNFLTHLPEWMIGNILPQSNICIFIDVIIFVKRGEQFNGHLLI